VWVDPLGHLGHELGRDEDDQDLDEDALHVKRAGSAGQGD